jgi:hypothetical protein
MGEKAAARSIEVRVDGFSQLFDTLDPFPFRERDLDKDAEEYIVGWAREFPREQPLEIIIYVPKDELTSKDADELGPALRRYFGYRAEMTGRSERVVSRWATISAHRHERPSHVRPDLANGHRRARKRKCQPLRRGKFDHSGLGCKLETDRDLPLRLVALARRRDLYCRLSAARVEVRMARSSGSATGP